LFGSKERSCDAEVEALDPVLLLVAVDAEALDSVRVRVTLEMVVEAVDEVRVLEEPPEKGVDIEDSELFRGNPNVDVDKLDSVLRLGIPA